MERRDRLSCVSRALGLGQHTEIHRVQHEGVYSISHPQPASLKFVPEVPMLGHTKSSSGKCRMGDNSNLPT